VDPEAGSEKGKQVKGCIIIANLNPKSRSSDPNQLYHCSTLQTRRKLQ